MSSPSGAVSTLIGLFRFAGLALVGLAQFADLALELLDTLLLGCGRAGSCAAVALALAHPLAQRLGRAADLARDRLDRRPLRRVLLLGIKDHAHRTLLNLGGKLRRLPHHGSILNRRSLLKIRGGSNSSGFFGSQLGSRWVTPFRFKNSLALSSENSAKSTILHRFSGNPPNLSEHVKISLVRY